MYTTRSGSAFGDNGLTAVYTRNNHERHRYSSDQWHPATQKGFVYDVVHLICQKPGEYASQTFSRLEKVYPELTPKMVSRQMTGVVL